MVPATRSLSYARELRPHRIERDHKIVGHDFAIPFDKAPGRRINESPRLVSFIVEAVSRVKTTVLLPMSLTTCLAPPFGTEWPKYGLGTEFSLIRLVAGPLPITTSFPHLGFDALRLVPMVVLASVGTQALQSDDSSSRPLRRVASNSEDEPVPLLGDIPLRTTLPLPPRDRTVFTRRVTLAPAVILQNRNTSPRLEEGHPVESPPP